MVAVEAINNNGHKATFRVSATGRWWFQVDIY
jgi:hypothetical protein